MTADPFLSLYSPSEVAAAQAVVNGIQRPDLDDIAPLIRREPVRKPRVTWACDIEMKPVVWAWTDDLGQGRMPTGSLSIAAGREGTGKSSFGIWLAAQITKGALPGSLHGPKRRVLYVAVEDSWEHTIAPRLAAAGADLSMVGRFDVVTEDAETFTEEQVTLSLPYDNRLLEDVITKHRVALVVMDPLMSLIGEKIDTNGSRSVRQALDPLAGIADRTSCLFLGIAHFNKGSSTDPSSLITGSGAFKDVPRSIFGFVRDGDSDEGIRVMSQTKNSLGRDELPSLKYVIENVVIDTPTGPSDVGRLVWRGESDRSAQEILRDAAKSPEDREEQLDAVTWLRGFLIDRGSEAAAKDVEAAGKGVGFSWDTLKRVKSKAKVVSRRTAVEGGHWLWVLKEYALPEERAEECEERALESPHPSLPSRSLRAEGEADTPVLDEWQLPNEETSA